MYQNINEKVDLNLNNFRLYRRVWIPLLVIAIVVFGWYINLDHEDQFQLTVEELQWLKDHPTITVGPNPIFPPYEFYDDNGEYSGLSADLFRLIGKKLGISIKTNRYDGRDARWQALHDGRIDVLGSVKKTPLREKDFLFSQPIAYSRDVIIVRSSITHSMTIDSLIGMRVAIPKNNAVYEELRNNYPGITIVPAGAGYASMYAVSFGTADATILNMGAASYYIEKTGLNNLRVAGNYNERSELSFGFSRNQTVLKSIIDKTLHSIPRDQREQINKKWLGLQVQAYWWSFIPWQWIVGILSGFVLAVLIIMFWNRMLQRQVQVKTSTLNLEIIERKIAENKFKEIITKNPMSIQILDKDGFTLEVNNSFKLLFGSVPPPGYSIFNDKQFAEQGMSEIFEQLRSGQVVHFPDVCFNPKDSIPGLKDVAVWTRTIGFPLNDSDDKPEQFVLMHENITDRKQAEEKLRALEEQYRTLFDHAPDGIFVADANGYYVDVNTQGAQMLGYKRDEIIGMHLFDLVKQELTPVVDKDYEEIKTGKSYHREWEFKRKDGSLLQGDLIGTTLPNGNVLGIVRDITERKKAEIALIENEEKYRLLYESNQMPVAIFDTETLMFLSVNNAFVNKYGYTRDEFLTMNILDIRPDSERDRVKQSAQIIDKGLVNLGEYLHKKKNGDIIHVEIIRYDLDFEGKKAKLVFANDITERKQAEAKLHDDQERIKTILNTAGEPIFVKDNDHRVIVANHAFYDMFGMDEKSVIGKTLAEDVPEDERQHFLAVDRSVLDTGTPHVCEETLTVQGKAARTIITTKVRFVESSGNKFLVGTIHDITEHLKSEQAIRQAQKLESIGTLAGGIAHDFNNLMNAVLGQTSLALQKLPKESPAVNNIQKAIKAGERVADLTRQLLAYSGRGRFVIDEIDLNKLVKENITMFEVSIPKTTQLRYELGTSSLHIIGDISQIQQVIMNLIINAGEAMGANPGYITVHTNRIELSENNREYSKYSVTPLAPGSYAMVQVKDNGSGMSEETLNRIFDPFFTTKFTGRGLGLAAVLGIIKGHKGGLRIESLVGKGTTFEIVWPLVQPSTISKISEKKEIVVNGEGRTILVIDDESSIIEMLDDVLSEVNFKVISASDPLKGIELYRQHHQNISLIILDYSMPHMDGRAAFEELIKINKNVKVLLSSGYSEEETMSVFGIDRPTGYFQKPYKPDALVQRVEEIVTKD